MQLRHWWLAIKVPSLPKIILPVVYGLGLGFFHSGEVHFPAAIVALAYGCLIQLFIVLLNDVADEAADTLHTSQFPELFDKRVIPQRLLSARQLTAAGATSGILIIILGLVITLVGKTPLALVFFVLSLFTFWVYSFPPFRLNYRGCGEIMEMLGVGLVLPLTAFYLYTANLEPFFLTYFLWIVPVLFMALASAASSGIKHLPADRLTGKRTLSVIFGPKFVASLIATLMGATLICYALLFWQYMDNLASYALLSFSVLGPGLLFLRMLGELKTADHSHLSSLRIFKTSLHYSIYSSLAGATLFLLLWTPALA